MRCWRETFFGAMRKSPNQGNSSPIFEFCTFLVKTYLLAPAFLFQHYGSSFTGVIVPRIKIETIESFLFEENFECCHSWALLEHQRVNS